MQLRWRKIAFDLSVGLLLAGLVLGYTHPWVRDPAGQLIGYYDPAYRMVGTDTMLSLSIVGWFKFALLTLGQSPLAHSTYINYPDGAGHGMSFDGLLITLLSLGFNLALPLESAFSLALLTGPWLMGWTLYRLGKKLWGRGAVAASVALCGAALPWFTQRIAAHPNLVHIWVIPAVMHLHYNFHLRPNYKRGLAFGLAPPLLASSSWYFLVAGMIYFVPAILYELMLALRARRVRIILPRLAAGWALGAVVLMTFGWRMFVYAHARKMFSAEELAVFAVPLLQHLMPFPTSWAGQLPFFAAWQQRIGTGWEGWAGGPVLALLLAPAYAIVRRAPGMRLLWLSVGALALLATTGPFLNLMRLHAPGEGLKTPVYYVGKVLPQAFFYRVPGRMHPVVNVMALLAAGGVLSVLIARLRPGLRLPAEIVAAVVFTTANLAFSINLNPYVVYPIQPIPPFYRNLANEPGGAILDIPQNFYYLPHYSYYQAWHHRPITCSTLFHDALRPQDIHWITSTPEMGLFGGMSTVSEEVRNEAATLGFLQRRADEGIQYVVVHPHLLAFLIEKANVPGVFREYYARCEAAWAPRLVYQDEDLRVYRTGLR